MNRFPLPTEVRPPPLPVPRFTVQNSRKQVAVSHDEPSHLPSELQVLRIEPDTGVREDTVLRPSTDGPMT